MQRPPLHLTLCVLGAALTFGCSEDPEPKNTATNKTTFTNTSSTTTTATTTTKDTTSSTTSSTTPVDMGVTSRVDMAIEVADMAPQTDASQEMPDMFVQPDASMGRQDIRGIVLTERSGDCAVYATKSLANVIDLQRKIDFTGLVDVEVQGGTCVLSSNAIPNHDFNEVGARFATPVAELETTWSIPRNPTIQPEPTQLELRSYDGVMLNGVVIDLLAAGCFGVGNGRIGCGDTSTPYRYDPLNPAAGFSTDDHNAHTQPDGRYHYHGDPGALYGPASSGPSGVIGFAADGFPIYGPYFMKEGVVQEAKSGYTLKQGMRAGGPPDDKTYDGTFIDDYEFTDAGDLDECNGMTIDGQYGYYLTSSYPWVLKCLRGTPDPSFSKRR